MRFAKSMFAVLAAVLAIAAAREAPAQQLDPYVSCVKCHALPMQQARAEMQGHGFAYPPAPEQACTDCHDTWWHEQDPNEPPYLPYFLFRAGNGPGSPMANACLGCHPSLPPGHHSSDVFPYFDTTPPSNPPLLPQSPTSVLPIFGFWGEPGQDPYFGGLVCSSCHDPHDPSYPVNGRSSFLRIGSFEQTAPLCGYCHVPDPPGAPTTGADLFIPSDSDSVRFQLMPSGDLQIDVTVQNRGNDFPMYYDGYVYWDDGTGVSLPVGPLSLGFIPPGGETIASVSWMPPLDWIYGEGFFVFELPPRPLLGSYLPVEFVRSMDIPPAPTNLRVTNATPGEISLEWDPPLNPPADLAWDVYRDGVKITPAPIFRQFPYPPQYTDFGLAPETPHVYTVVALKMTGGLPSPPSDPVGATTGTGQVIRVPQEYPTIQAAIDAAWSMTSIHVAPGTYTEALNLSNKYGITIKGQDANGCILDYTGPLGAPIDLGPTAVPGQPGNTLSGFTVRNGAIMMGPGDVVTGCVITSDSQHPNPAIIGGGLVAQCVFDTGPRPALGIDPDLFFTSVNSIYLGSQPFIIPAPLSTGLLLLNNDFPAWFDWWQHQGSGNFSAPPLFAAPGPPLEYLPAADSPTVGRGLPLGGPSFGLDVGAFQVWTFYTPQPPANLAATFVPAPVRRIQLTWNPSIDDPERIISYLIYRSESQDFPPATEINAYAMVPPGVSSFDDYDLAPGATYSYQVRAFAGLSVPPPGNELLSAPTNTASALDVNNPPVAVDDVATVPEDLSVTIPVLANDSDPDGDVFHILDVGYPLYGTAVMNADETIQYTPYPGFSGTDSFTYTVLDVRFGSATAFVTVTVVPSANTPPTAVNDAYTTAEDTVLLVPAPGVLGNDTDPDGDALEALLVMGPTHGTLTLNRDGSFVYTTAANYSGPDSFTYFAGDFRLASVPATVTITVLATNTPPVANSQTVTAAEDTAVAVTLTATDADGDALTYSVSAGPTHGTLSGSAPNLTYTPNANFSGSDSFTFSVSDGQATSATATVTIVVTAVNDPPTAGNDTYSTLEDTALIVIAPGVLGNDVDAEGGTLSAALVSGPLHGTLSLDALGGFTYTPAANFNGSDSFTYRTGDGQASSAVATVTIAVTPVNDQPVANGQALTTAEDTILHMTVTGTDVDHDLLSYRVVREPAHGWVGGPAQFLSYTPSANFNGTDSFTFVVNDGQTDSSEATVTITVTPVDDWPQAQGQTVMTAEDTPVPVTLVATDVDGDPLMYALVSLPAHGSLVGAAPNLTYVPAANYYDVDSFTFTASDGRTTTPVTTVSITVTPVNDPPSFVMGPEVTVNEDADVQTVPAWATSIDDGDPVGSQVLTFTLTNNNPTLFNLQPRISYDGTLTFAAPINAHGTATVTVTLTDDDRAGGAAITTPPQTFTITVVSVNDPPWAWGQSMTAAEDAATPVTLTALETEGDALTFAVVQGPSHGTLSGVKPNLTYTSAANYNGPDSFTFTANDGQAISNVATVIINVTPVNDAPTVTDGAGSFVEDTPRTVAAPGVLNFAADIDNFALSAVLVQGPAHGSLTLNANGSYTYAPAADYTGPDSFTYRASDGQAESNVGTITLTVTPVNDPPVAIAKSCTTSEDAQLIVDAQAGLLAGATDVDSPVTSGGPHSYPSHGILQWESNGSFKYTPAANFSGTDSFTYIVSDGWANSPEQTVTITVTAVNDPPVATPQSVTTAEDTALGLTLAAADVEGDALTYALATGPAHGTLSGAAPNLTYTPAANYNGSDSFTFTASDGKATSTPATVTITVTPVNDPPIAQAGPDQAGLVGQVLTFSGAASSDPDGTIVSYSWSWGDGMPDGAGVDASHAYATSGPFTVTLTVTNNTGATATDAALVTVTAPANLALNKPASASTTRSSTYAAAKAVDGSTSTSWMSSTTSGSQWVRVDLGSSLSISNIQVLWPATYYAKGFRIETSTDGNSWTQQYSATAATGAATNAVFPAVSVRFVRVSCTARNNSKYYGVAEIAVYAVAPPNQPPLAAAGPDQTGTVGQALSFSGAASADPDGTIVAYLWSWGDGSADSTGVNATHTYAAAGTMTVTLTVTDSAGATATDSAVVTVNPAPANLALSKPARASTTRSSSYAAANAVDGSAATSWMSSTTSGAQWLQVDLGASQSISNVNIGWPATYYAKGFRIETSPNGTTWTQQFSTTSGSGGRTSATFPAVSARYVLVTCTAHNNSKYYGVAELEVYH